jgi:hypothetical protein
MPNSSVNYGLLEPLVNDATDSDLWGGYLNTTISDLDGLMLTAMSFTPSAQTSTITVVAPTTGSTSTGNARTLFTCNATGGAFAANLPSASSASGMVVAFKKMDVSTNAITITGNGGDLIDGANTYALSTQYQYVILSCDGTQWNILSSFINTITAVTQAVGNQSTLIANTQFVNPAFSLAANGYVKLPSGLIIQWGISGSISPNTTGSVNFPIAFPTAVFSATITPHVLAQTGSQSGPSSASAASLSVLSIYNGSAVTTETFNWTAFGN